ncbi:protein phosphatase regulator [Sporothrix bragantina]|uniref:Protein phosphatase regulator n=1 Tax=Sporothrix bragantina TaxID=671064 RepID=A0ABP0C4G3_9PEZI
MAEGLSKDEIISSFCGITGVSSSEASGFLDAADWDADAALAEYYQSQEDAAAGTAAGTDAAPTVDPSYTGPRTLDGRPAPHAQSAAPASSSSRAAPQAKKRGLMTMSSLRGGEPSGHGHGGHGHGHGHDDDDDDDDYSDDDDENNGGRGDLFAGGEKSGLAVQDPTMGDRGASSDAKRVMRDIVAQAKANHRASQAGGGGPSTQAQAQAPPSRFRGAGQTLGGEGVESRTIPDASAATTTGATGSGASGAGAAATDIPEERTLHIWQDGFSIDDGPLHRYDDPSNAADLQMIRQGRAPLHLMNVPFGQAVDIKLHEHQERWHQLPRVYRPFSGEGRRLGAPVPGASSSISETASTAPAASSSSVSASSSTVPTVDESLPTLTIRVQLPDGTRLPARFNTTQTIGDVYSFVERALPAGSQSRSWVLATTFPNKEHTDKDLVLGETAEFKRGGAAVVKWV